MDILPHNYAQFKHKQYWDHFFTSLKNTNNEFFQWYGAYQDYQHILNYLINSAGLQAQGSKTIFHVGCGKSTFAQHLLQQHPKQNELKIINCDYSESVINQMKQRALQLNIKMDYVVYDLLMPLQENFCGYFDVVLDKGTLDAMLPEDNPANIQKIKSQYFFNMQKALATNATSLIKSPKFIIISLLQPFVLRTILQQYGFKKNFFIDIYECLIKDSKMQPFLVCISIVNQMQENAKCICFHKLGKDQTIKWMSVNEVLNGIQNAQKQVNFGHKIEQLLPGRRTKFNIYNQQNKKAIRYLIQVIDSEDRKVLGNNSCAIFIVPQGRENSYTFDDLDGIKSLHSQIASSRLLLVKLVTGNTFNSLEQVKKELNQIIPDFVQHGCKISTVAYLTDADQLGNRKYLYYKDDDDFIFDQVVVGGQCTRRFFLKSNPITPQCQFKLTYMSQTNNKGHQDTGSKIMPLKKGMIIGIDRQTLFDDSAKFIYSGLSAFHSHPSEGTWKVLILGCQFSLAKFLIQNHEAVQVTVVIGNHKQSKQILYKYFELQEQLEQLTICCISPAQYFGDHHQQKFNIIIDCTNENGCQNPPKNQTSSHFLQKIEMMLQKPGIYVCQFKNYATMPKFIDFFFPIYGSGTNDQTQNIVFCLMHKKNVVDGKIAVHESLVNYKPKSKTQYQWQSQNIEDIVLLEPKVTRNADKSLQYDAKSILLQTQSPFEDIYAKQSSKSQKKKKKKKKK